MDATEPVSRPRRSRAPLWVIEGLDIARLRAVPLRTVLVVVCVVGLVLAIVLPDLVPATPLVGAAVALAALLLGLAVAVAVDAADLTVRGPRHVRAAGGELVAILPTTPDPDEVAPLAAAVLEAREGEGKRLLLGLAAAGRDARRCAAWTDALAVAIARTGASVLRVDLASGRSERPGLVEVVREGRKLPAVVSFERDLRLARVGAGRDHAGALEVLPIFPTRLPRDLDVLLVALPTAASRQVVAATRALDHVLVVAERDTTSRVDLIAGLDALEAADIAAQVALLDDHTSSRLGASPASVGHLEPGTQADADDRDPPIARTEPAATGDDVGAAGPAPQPATDRPAQPGSTERGEADPDHRPDVVTPTASAPEPVVPSAGAPRNDPDANEHARGPERDAPAAEPAPAPAAPTEHAPQSADGSATDDVADRGIRLLPGAERTRPGRSDLQQPSVAPRDVDVMLGAAAADAAARVDAAEDPDPDPDPEPAAEGTAPRPRPVDATSEPAAVTPSAERLPADTAPEPTPAPSPTGPQAGVVAPHRPAPRRPMGQAPTDVPIADPVDVTDELPRIQGGPPRPGRRDPEEPERDDLRTTAQLAILIDDLQSRPDGS
jgi:hypothetical protein